MYYGMYVSYIIHTEYSTVQSVTLVVLYCTLYSHFCAGGYMGAEKRSFFNSVKHRFFRLSFPSLIIIIHMYLKIPCTEVCNNVCT